MITTAHQRRVTADRIARFEVALASVQALGPGPDVHPALHRAEVDGLRSVLADLRAEAADWDRRTA